MFTLLGLVFVFTVASAHHSSWHPISPTNPSELIEYSLMLPQNNLDKLFKAVQFVSDPASPYYGDYWTHEQIEQLVSPPKRIINTVSSFIDHISNQAKCSFHGDFFRCHSKVRDVEQLFNVTMWNFINLERPGLYAVRALRDYTIPELIKDQVEFISGISNHLMRPRHLPRVKIQAPNVDSRFVARESLRRMYNVSVEHLCNSTITLVEFQANGFNQSDLDNSSVANGVTPLTVSEVAGSNFGGDIETELDVTMALDLLSSTHVNSSDTNHTVRWANYPKWLDDMTADVLTRKDVSEVLSLSYGWAERDQCAIITCNSTYNSSEQFVNRVNTDLAKIALLGVTVVVASGDAGAPGRTNENCGIDNPINPVFPGSSPFVLSVGATATLTDNTTVKWKSPICKDLGCTTGFRTVPVNYDNVGWTSGSGFGIYSTELRATNAPWQDEVVTEYLNSGVVLPDPTYWNSDGRGYPDVTANGHNCPVFDIYGQGQFQGVDGTSCSAPVWGSLVSLINDYQKSHGRPRVGLVTPLLYALAKQCPEGFTPVSDPGNSHCTEYQCCGSDFGFTTPPHPTKWNPVTGLGQPNVGNLFDCLDKMFEK